MQVPAARCFAACGAECLQAQRLYARLSRLSIADLHLAFILYPPKRLRSEGTEIHPNIIVLLGLAPFASLSLGSLGIWDSMKSRTDTQERKLSQGCGPAAKVALYDSVAAATNPSMGKTPGNRCSYNLGGLLCRRKCPTISESLLGPLSFGNSHINRLIRSS